MQQVHLLLVKENGRISVESANRAFSRLRSQMKVSVAVSEYEISDVPGKAPTQYLLIKFVCGLAGVSQSDFVTEARTLLKAAKEMMDVDIHM